MSENKNPDMIVTKSEQDGLESKKQNLDWFFKRKCNGQWLQRWDFVACLFILAGYFQTHSFMEREQAVNETKPVYKEKERKSLGSGQGQNSELLG